MVRLTSKHNPSFDDDDDEDDEFTPTCLRTTGSDSSDHPNNSSQHQARHRRFSSSIYTKKKQLDLIYGIHALFAAVTGAIAVVHPQLYEIFMNLKAEEQGCRIMAEQANTIIRLYGALIFSQSWLVWKTREVPDPFVRKIFAQGYLLCFSTSTLVLGYAQLVATSFKRATKRLIVPCRYKQIFSSEWAGYNWPVIGMFFFFSAIYAWFLLTKKLPEFEHSVAATV